MHPYRLLVTRTLAVLVLCTVLPTLVASAASDSHTSTTNSEPFCTTKQLVLVIAPGAKGIKGERFDAYALLNRTSTCQVKGFPAITLLNDKTTLQFTFSHSKNAYTSSATPKSVVLKRNGRAYFLLAKAACTQGNASVVNVLHLRMPRVAGVIAVTATPVKKSGVNTGQLAYCKGGANAADQTIYVSPLTSSRSDLAAKQ